MSVVSIFLLEDTVFILLGCFLFLVSMGLFIWIVVVIWSLSLSLYHDYRAGRPLQVNLELFNKCVLV
jgi:hypothetical protein